MNEFHDAVTGQFAPKDQDPKTTVRVEEDRLSPWRKEGERLLGVIEREAELGSRGEPGVIDEATIALVIHIQSLKRV